MSEKLIEKEITKIDNELDELDTRLTVLYNVHDLAVDFITEFALNKLTLADYDLVIKHLIHNRHLHDEVEAK